MGTNGSESKLAVAGSFGLILAIAGVVLTQQQLKSSRPLEKPNMTQESVGEKAVPARLWEDPLEAVQRAKDGQGVTTDPPYQPRVFDPIRSRIAAEPGKWNTPLDILLVMTEGGPYAEGKEDRIRDRYAIASALGVSCYVPADEEHLAYVKWQVGGIPRHLPYEWYRERKTRRCSHDGQRAERVLVLWVTSEILDEQPLRSLARLIGSLCDNPYAGAEQCKGRVGPSQIARIKVIGPHSSSDFRVWLEEAVRPQKPAWFTYNNRVELYSPWATAMPSLLMSQLNGGSDPQTTPCESPEQCQERLKGILSDAGIDLKYSIGSDDQLLAALVEELERRQVKFEKDAVVLVGEWDTFYGRALPIEFRAAACHQIELGKDYKQYAYIEKGKRSDIEAKCGSLQKGIELQVNDQQGYEELKLNIWRYSYLRGLDGQIPGNKEDTVKGNNDKSEGDEKKKKIPVLEDRFMERPVGPSQFDYTRRLADRIAYETKTEDTKVRAVGILGTDPYDALLILQALRERFPTAIFFLTDLDARLVYSDEYRWTRNLVIAAHFGLALNDELQRDIPPFRSGYQTSAFFATLQAVGHVQALDSCPPLERQNGICGYRANLSDERFDAHEAPRLYEVGRHGPVDLSVGVPREGYQSLHARRLDLEKGKVNGVQPDPVKVWAGVALCSIVFGAVLLSYRGTALLIKKVEFEWLVITFSLFGLVYPFGLESLVQKAGKLMANHDVGEPFYWSEGVSIWPTEIIRLIAVLLAVSLIVKGSLDLGFNRREVEGRFAFIPSSQKPECRWDRFRESWFTPGGRNRQREAWLVVLGLPNRDAQEKVSHLWNLYVEAGSMTAVVFRVVIIFELIKLVIGLALDAIGTPDWKVPCRGEFSCSWDSWIVRYLLIPAAMLLTAFVLDQAMLCHRWICTLSNAKGGWPHPATDQENCLNKVRLVEKRTEVVSRIIAYPPLIWLLIIVARNKYFDQWDFPPHLIVAWITNMTMALTPALLLYWAAEKMRGRVADELNGLLHKKLGQGESAASEAAHIREAIRDVESIKKGAFLPLWQQPFVQTLLYGVVALLQYLYLGT